MQPKLSKASKFAAVWALVALAVLLSICLRGWQKGLLAEPSPSYTALRATGQHAATTQPKYPSIPRIIHQVMGMYDKWTRPVNWTAPANLTLPFLKSGVQECMQSWVDMNPGWEYRLWDRSDVEALVREHYPHLWTAWGQLPRDVERSDFARYILIHHYGGVYADSDVKCVRGMDSLLRPKDGLVAAWEDLLEPRMAWDWAFGRPSQIVNWWFAAALGHPALGWLLETIRQNAGERLYAHPVIDTILRTGPGAFTDAVLRGAQEHPPSKGDGLSVRVLPRLCGGSLAPGFLVVPPPSIIHIFSSSWKAQPLTLASNMKARFPAGHYEPQPDLLPTSALFDPPFTVLHHARRRGDFVGGIDVSFQIAKYGVWQPNNLLSFPPVVVEEFLEGLAPGARSPPVVVDIGAGYGYFSLAAAARGLWVVTFEAANKSGAALGASIAYNGFPIRLEQLALGSEGQQGPICLDPPRVTPPKVKQQQQQQPTAAQEAAQHGYGPAAAHIQHGGCAQQSQREPANQAVQRALDHFPGARVAAVRVSAYGWGLHLLRALRPLLESHPVRTLQLEWSAEGGVPEGAAAEGAAGTAGTAGRGQQALAGMLQELMGLGFVEVRHRGDLCAARWREKKDHVLFLPRDSMRDARVDTRLLESAACRLAPGEFQGFEKLPPLNDSRVETFLLRRPTAWLPRGLG